MGKMSRPLPINRYKQISPNIKNPFSSSNTSSKKNKKTCFFVLSMCAFFLYINSMLLDWDDDVPVPIIPTVVSSASNSMSTSTTIHDHVDIGLLHESDHNSDYNDSTSSSEDGDNEKEEGEGEEEGEEDDGGKTSIEINWERPIGGIQEEKYLPVSGEDEQDDENKDDDDEDDDGGKEGEEGDDVYYKEEEEENQDENTPSLEENETMKQSDDEPAIDQEEEDELSGVVNNISLEDRNIDDKHGNAEVGEVDELEEITDDTEQNDAEEDIEEGKVEDEDETNIETRITGDETDEIMDSSTTEEGKEKEVTTATEESKSDSLSSLDACETNPFASVLDKTFQEISQILESQGTLDVDESSLSDDKEVGEDDDLKEVEDMDKEQVLEAQGTTVDVEKSSSDQKEIEEDDDLKEVEDMDKEQVLEAQGTTVDVEKSSSDQKEIEEDDDLKEVEDMDKEQVLEAQGKSLSDKKEVEEDDDLEDIDNEQGQAEEQTPELLEVNENESKNEFIRSGDLEGSDITRDEEETLENENVRRHLRGGVQYVRKLEENITSVEEEEIEATDEEEIEATDKDDDEEEIEATDEDDEEEEIESTAVKKEIEATAKTDEEQEADLEIPNVLTVKCGTNESLSFLPGICGVEQHVKEETTQEEKEISSSSSSSSSKTTDSSETTCTYYVAFSDVMPVYNEDEEGTDDSTIPSYMQLLQKTNCNIVVTQLCSDTQIVLDIDTTTLDDEYKQRITILDDVCLMPSASIVNGESIDEGNTSEDVNEENQDAKIEEEVEENEGEESINEDESEEEASSEEQGDSANEAEENSDVEQDDEDESEEEEDTENEDEAEENSAVEQHDDEEDESEEVASIEEGDNESGDDEIITENEEDMTDVESRTRRRLDASPEVASDNQMDLLYIDLPEDESFPFSFFIELFKSEELILVPLEVTGEDKIKQDSVSLPMQLVVNKNVKYNAEVRHEVEVEALSNGYITVDGFTTMKEEEEVNTLTMVRFQCPIMDKSSMGGSASFLGAFPM